MRRNTRRVVEAWLNKRPCRASLAVWTDGVAIYSYATCIVAAAHGRPILNMSRYSCTTTCHQDGIAFLLVDREVVEVTGLRQGAYSAELREAARAAVLGFRDDTPAGILADAELEMQGGRVEV